MPKGHWSAVELRGTPRIHQGGSVINESGLIHKVFGRRSLFMSGRPDFFLPWNASKARLREAENARKNRLEIVKALSHGTVSRRELLKWGLITGAGLLAPIHGLSPFVKSAYADDGGGIPTGAPPSPGTVGLAFTQPLLRFEVLPRYPYTALSPTPTIEANTLQTYNVDPMLG